MELGNIQSVLQDAGIEVDIKTLQNPTEEFMIELVTKYLKKFNIDGDEIAKPTMEQLDRVSCEESAMNAIRAINLHAALATLCDKIFLKDLTLTDITSPGCKKACKRIKVLFNFFVYVRNKKMEKEFLFCQLDSRQKEFQDMVEKKSEYTIETGAVIAEREMKIEYKERLKKEIEAMELMVSREDKVRNKLQMHIEELKAKEQREIKRNNDLKTKALELHKITRDLQSKIVESPEDIMSRNEELQKIVKEKMEERQNLCDGIHNKKDQIRKNELAELELKKHLEKTTNVGEVMKKMKDIISQINSSKKLLEELRGEIHLLESNPNAVMNKLCDLEVQELEQNQRILTELQNSLNEKQRDYESLKLKLVDMCDEKKNTEMKLKEEKEKIAFALDDYKKLLASMKTLLHGKITKERDMRKYLQRFYE